MSNLWYRTFLSFFFILIIGVNMAYAFDMLKNVVPTSLPGDYSMKWFSFGSFMSNFDNYFKNNSIISGMNHVLNQYANMVTRMYGLLTALPKSISALTGGSSYAWEIISLLFAILTIITNIIPTIVVVIYGLLLILAVLIYILTFLLFVLSFFSGAFAQDLPSTYPELNTELSIITDNIRCYLSCC